jgi:hypothetical protein
MGVASNTPSTAKLLQKAKMWSTGETVIQRSRLSAEDNATEALSPEIDAEANTPDQQQLRYNPPERTESDGWKWRCQSGTAVARICQRCAT